MPGNLSVDLREAHRNLARGEVQRDRPRLDEVRVLVAKGRCGRVAALSGVVEAYRAGPKKVWGTVLLDLLAPAILANLRRLNPQPPVMDPEDLRQQLLLEVLVAAATMPLPENRSYLRSRLMSRANQGARRWLVREARRQAAQRPIELADKGSR